MRRRLAVAPHLDPDELRRRSRAAPPADRVRWLAVRVIAERQQADDTGAERADHRRPQHQPVAWQLDISRRLAQGPAKEV